MHSHTCPSCGTTWWHNDDHFGIEVSHLCPTCGYGPVWVGRETTFGMLYRLYRSGLLWFVFVLQIWGCSRPWVVLGNKAQPEYEVKCEYRMWYISGTSILKAGNIVCSSGAAAPQEQRR